MRKILLALLLIPSIALASPQTQPLDMQNFQINNLAAGTASTDAANVGQCIDPASISGTGLIAKTGAGTYATRTITGTANQVIVSNGDGVSGNPTLSTPQNIHTGATPQFAGVTLGGHSTFTANNSWQIGNETSPNLASAIWSVVFGSANVDLAIQTATAHDVVIKPNGTSRWRFKSGGNFEPNDTNNTDIGSSSKRVLGTYSGTIDLSGDAIFSASTAGLDFTRGADLAATGSAQSDAAQIVDRLFWATGADGTKGVKLPATPDDGEIWMLLNAANAVLKLYPGSGDEIWPTAVDTSVDIAAYAIVLCFSRGSATWTCAEMPRA